MNGSQKPRPEPCRRLSHRDVDACASVLHRLYAATSPHNFPQRLLEILFELVPSEHVSYNEFNDREPRYVAVSFPHRPEIQQFVPQIEKHLSSHPLFEHVQRAGTEPQKISDVVTFRQFSDTALYQEYYRHIGTKHQLLFFLSAPPGSRIGLALNRDRSDFTERDRSVLTFLSPHVSRAYQNVRVASELAGSMECLGKGLDSIRRAVLLADAHGAIRWQSPLALEWLREFFPIHPSTQRLPPELKNWLNRAESSINQGGGRFFRTAILLHRGLSFIDLFRKIG